jgi:ribosome-associated protein
VTEIGSETLARRLAELADSKQGDRIVVLDMRTLVAYTDFLAICTARNERHTRAIVEEVKLQVKNDEGRLPGGMEGESGDGWIVRERYQLEDLWREAPRLELGLDAPEASSAASG